ncbi:MAG: zf-HC2 domain-containing protein [Bacteroidales bacterium]|jgi:anti-sigma factor RsiW|nr:zf-HC2 domain-containing protein [Bacteroidales bacterium]MDD4214484.1 zf-HC2 domain-containing protein [Bacteroidales bacterium]
MKHLDENIIIAYADNLLSGTELAAAGMHLEECEACRHLLKSYRSLNALMQNNNVIKAPTTLKSNVMYAIELHRKIALHKKKSRRVFLVYALIMSALMIPAIVFAFISGDGLLFQFPVWLQSAFTHMDYMKIPIQIQNPLIFYVIVAIISIFIIENSIRFVHKRRKVK